MNGIINVFKEKGYTSFDVCAKLRGILKTKKIGHTGTLDPQAEGVLPVCVGNATKLCDLLTDKDKTYETVLCLGMTTDTEDMTGTILTQNSVCVTKEEAELAITSFIGTYEQIPPMYSAIKVNGKRLYEMAREGIVIERKSRSVTIHEIKILDWVMQEENPSYVKEIKMSVTCSKGTYIRTLCKDIGERLRCGGCMKQLLRTRVSVFLIEDSLTLSEIAERINEQKLDQVLLPVDEMFQEYPKAKVEVEAVRFLYNGNQLKQNQLIFTKEIAPEDGLKIRVYDNNNIFTGLYEYTTKKMCFQPVKMFLQ